MWTHRPEDRPFKCIQCDFSCVRKITLERHVAYRHEQNSKFFCIICKEQFGAKSQVDGHLQKHTKDYEKLQKLMEENARLKKRLKKHQRKEQNISNEEESKKRKKTSADNADNIDNDDDGTSVITKKRNMTI